MGEIVIHRGAEKINLFSLIPFVTVTNANHIQELMSADRIEITLESTAPMIFYLGDYIEQAGRKFTLNQNPKLQKINEKHYIYNMYFEGVQYDLLRKKYFNYDAQGFYTTGDFPLTGEIDVFLIALLNNAERDENEYDWILGEVPENTETKTITFDNANCLGALQTICQEFEQEFEIIQDIVAKTNTLNVKKIGSTLPYSFEYGMGNGLYGLERDNVSDGQVITRLYPYGSTENIPTNYRDFSPRLKLPQSYGNYIQDNAKVALYGLVEEIKNYDDIKPTFKGVISSVGAINTNKGTVEIVCPDIDFDLNEKKADGVSTKYLIAGTPAKIHVNKGNLAGYDFEIHKYTHATKTLEVKQFIDERDQKFPDAGTVFNFAIGDEFTFIDIIMPDIYITNAENKLKDKALEDYGKLSQNNVKYSLDIDPLFFASIGGGTDVSHLGIGDYINVKDSALAIDKTSRIISLTRDLLNFDGYKYSAEISDSYEISTVVQILQEIQTVSSQVQTVTVKNREAMLSGYRRMMELQGLVFDTDGYFDPINIKPNSIETNMLTVGAKSQQLTLESVLFTANKNNNPNLVNISNGKLVHFSIDETGIKEWSLLGVEQTLPTSSAYYVYARVPRETNTGTYLITTEKRKFDAESNFYNFLVAVLFAPANNIRLIELMYGTTFIHGRTITTGKIQSVDGLTWFDLDTGEFHGKFTFTDGTNVQTAVANAQSNATSALNQLTDIGSDNKLTASEKQSTLTEWNRIKSEYQQNNNVATVLGISLIAYQNAYNVLNSYITPLLSILTTTSTIDGSVFRTNFKNYYDQNILIVTAIENKKIENINIGGRNLARNSKGLLNQNTYWVRDFDLSENLVVGKEYTVTVITNAVSQNPNAFFEIGDSAGRITYLNKKSSTRFEITFIAPRASNKIILFREPNDNSYYQFLSFKIEKGNKATDWTPAPEDVDLAIANANTNSANALAQAQNALNTANATASVTNFLQTTIDGNVVSTGTLQVGEVNGANGGITGVIDNGLDSVSLWFGATYANRYNAPFRTTQRGYTYLSGIEIESKKPNSNAGVKIKDGLITITRTDTSKAFEFGVVDDKETFNIYNSSGILVAKIDDRGISFTGYIPESFDELGFRKLTGNTQADRLNQFSNNVARNGSNFFLVTDLLGYEYQAGYNFESAMNSIYQGKIFSSENKLGNFIEDGFYGVYFFTNIPVTSETQNITIYGVIWHIVSGIIVSTENATFTKRANQFVIV